MKGWKDFLKKPINLKKKKEVSRDEVIEILKEFEYILLDEGCEVSYDKIGEIRKDCNDLVVKILTPDYLEQNFEKSPVGYNKTVYNFVEQFKQEDYFEEYIDRIFEEIPKTSFHIMFMVDGLNFVYNIHNGSLVDAENLLRKKGKILIKEKK